ncbi:MAG: DUF2252 family protein [Terriglobales bacterium]|jgi:hypothetical protein
MNIVKSTRGFETWLGQHTTIVKPDLRLKHQRMADSPFPFFRATFYRWMQLWPEVCPALAKAPRVLAVGDLHVENFGTWRDIEGRLVWGINDFDEAGTLPYTVDLVRLATSALLASEEGHMRLQSKDACAALLDGYHESLVESGRPFVLEEEHKWLRQIALNELRDPVHFWAKMEALPKIPGKLPRKLRESLDRLMPEPGLEYRTVRRVAGLGSLGHVRVVALAECHGGRIAREAKALSPSAISWAAGKKGPGKIAYQEILDRAVRDPDPFVKLRGSWIVRRLAPFCSRIELAVLPSNRDEIRLLFAMGWETANIHLGTRDARKNVSRHLDRLKPVQLLSAAIDMAKALTKDWRAWKQSQES